MLSRWNNKKKRNSIMSQDSGVSGGGSSSRNSIASRRFSFDDALEQVRQVLLVTGHTVSCVCRYMYRLSSETRGSDGAVHVWMVILKTYPSRELVR